MALQSGHFFPAFSLLPARATFKAIATACFWGLPAALSVRIFWGTAPFPRISIDYVMWR